jgi:hypothetical protein
MKRRPVTTPAAPAYPDRRRARSWALGLIALGTSGVVCAPLVGCGNMMPPEAHGEHACAGDMIAPDPESPATEQEGATKSEPCVIPEVGEDPNVTPTETHIRGDMPAVLGDMPMPEPSPAPEPPPTANPDPTIIPEVQPGPIDGDVPAVDGDMPLPEPETQPEEATVTPEPLDYRVAGGLPAPTWDPDDAQVPPGEGAESEPRPRVEDEPVPGGMPMPMPGTPPVPSEDDDED